MVRWAQNREKIITGRIERHKRLFQLEVPYNSNPKIPYACARARERQGLKFHGRDILVGVF